MQVNQLASASVYSKPGMAAGGECCFLVRRQERDTAPMAQAKKKPGDARLPQSKSLGFFLFIHFCFNGIADKTVQAFTLTGGEVLDDLPLSFVDDNIDSVIRFFVVTRSGFLLGVGILQNHHLLHILT